MFLVIAVYRIQTSIGMAQQITPSCGISTVASAYGHQILADHYACDVLLAPF